LDGFPQTHLQLIKELEEETAEKMKDLAKFTESTELENEESLDDSDDDFKDAIMLLKDCGLSAYMEEKKKKQVSCIIYHDKFAIKKRLNFFSRK
jgi:hypothetical protein